MLRNALFKTQGLPKSKPPAKLKPRLGAATTACFSPLQVINFLTTNPFFHENHANSLEKHLNTSPTSSNYSINKVALSLVFPKLFTFAHKWTHFQNGIDNHGSFMEVLLNPPTGFIAPPVVQSTQQFDSKLIDLFNRKMTGDLGKEIAISPYTEIEQFYILNFWRRVSENSSLDNASPEQYIHLYPELLLIEAEKLAQLVFKSHLSILLDTIKPIVNNTGYWEEAGNPPFILHIKQILENSNSETDIAKWKKIICHQDVSKVFDPRLGYFMNLLLNEDIPSLEHLANHIQAVAPYKSRFSFYPDN